MSRLVVMLFVLLGSFAMPASAAPCHEVTTASDHAMQIDHGAPTTPRHDDSAAAHVCAGCALLRDAAAPTEPQSIVRETLSAEPVAVLLRSLPGLEPPPPRD